jgi:hypothetical protein
VKCALGRTRHGVYSRRDQKALGPPHGNKKPKKRLRREFFSTGQGPREEVVPPPPLSMCRYCERQAMARGLCKKCYRWVQRVVESGAVSWELADRLWLSPARGGAVHRRP